MIFGSARAWCLALWIAVMIHLDFHIARPAHEHWSLGLTYHWLLGVLVFALLPRLVVARWPSAFAQASVAIILLGVVLGQGLEPLGEMVLFPGEQPFADTYRWRIFGEFLLAGLLAYGAAAPLALRNRRGDTFTS